MSEGHAVERRLISILFADLVGFTALSETLDAEEVAFVQERYFAQVRETVARHGGRVEKFIGDAAMAVFGLPLTRDDDAERAVRAGLALIHATEALSVEVGLGEGDLRLRVGVNSGEVAYSLADGEEWRVSGDAVNVAARLQAAAEPGTVLVGEDTALSVAEAIALDPPVELRLKGKAEAVRAWRAASALPHRSRERALGELRAPTVGREQELAALTAAVDRVRAGSTEAFLVIAPPGVGKSRLIGELVRRMAGDAPAQAMAVRRARLRPEIIAPAAVAAQLLADAVAVDGTLAELAQDARRRLIDAGVADIRATELADEVSRLVEVGSAVDDGAPAGPAEDRGSTAAAPGGGAAHDRAVVFRRWIDALDGLSDGRPALWLLEDLHWSGGDVLAFVEQAAEQPAPSGRLLLGTARPALRESLAGRAGTSRTTILDLPALPPTEARELVRALVGEALPGRLEQALVERSDGNPLFIEELLRSWVSLGMLVLDEDGTWRMTAALDEIALPHTVHAIYAAQLDDLPRAARLLTRRASVAGRHVPRRSLDSLDITAVDEGIEIVRRRALLIDGAGDPLVGPELTYRHVLLRDAGYASLSRAERARLHARLARWYETVVGPRVGEVAEQIAGHYAAALANASRLSTRIDDDLDAERARRLAIEWYERAADYALTGAAHETGRALLHRALDHVAADEVLVRGRLLLRLGEATAYTADMDEGIRLMEEARRLLRDLHREATDPGIRADARAGYAAAAAAIGRAWIQQVRFDEAVALADETLADIGGPDDAGVARLLGLRGWVRSTLTEDPQSLGDIERALDIARLTEDRQLELEILHWRAMARGEVGLVEKADWEAVGELALLLNDWSRAVKALRFSAAWVLDDHADEVWPIADQAQEICRRRGLEEDLAWIDYLRSEAGFVSGDWDAALGAGRRAIEVGERNAYHRAVVRAWHVVLPIAELRGERELITHAHRWFEARRHSFPDSPYARLMQWVFETRFIRAGLSPMTLPDPDRLLPSFESEPGGPSLLSAIEDVVEAWLAAGELDAVRGALERTDRALAAAPDASSLARGCATYLRTRLTVAQGSGGGDVERLARLALESFRHGSAPWWIAKSLRVLEAAGLASDDESAELRDIRQRLGLARRVSV